MKLTRNLKLFIVFNLVITAAFYWLSVVNDVGVETVKNADGTESISTSMPFVWMLLIAIAFVVFYKTDNRRATRSDLAFKYHVSCVSVVFIPLFVTVILAPFTDIAFDAFLIVPLVALSLSLAVHWFFARKTLKGHEPKIVFK